MRLSLFGIGAKLRSEDGYAKIMELVPGGPALKGGKMKVGDRIVAVAQGDKEFVDCVDLKLDKVVNMIRGKKDTLVRIQVIPVDGTTGSERTTIEIKRDEVKLKDEEGKEVLIKIITKDGKIAERENVELPEPEMEEVEEEMGMTTPALSQGNDNMEGFKKEIMAVLGEIKDKIDAVVADQEEMKKKVSKFAKEPAGEPLRMGKNQIQTELNQAKDDYISQLVSIRQGSKK
jgi:carboxyl-terminal processing protease